MLTSSPSQRTILNALGSRRSRVEVAVHGLHHERRKTLHAVARGGVVGIVAVPLRQGQDRDECDPVDPGQRADRVSKFLDQSHPEALRGTQRRGEATVAAFRMGYPRSALTVAFG